jgi:hypothetical protein
MVGRYLDEDDRYAVWILDPHFDKTPRFLARPSDDVNTGCVQPLMLGFEVADLDPEGQVAARRFCGLPTDFKEASSQEEDQPRCIGRAELSKDGESQRVSIEVAAALRLARTQQNAASQSLHGLIMPGLALPGRRPPGRARYRAVPRSAK